MERKLVAILFADAIGSTSLGDHLDPERLRALLDAYFATMASAVQAWGVTVEKFIGDAVMAVFGALSPGGRRGASPQRCDGDDGTPWRAQSRTAFATWRDAAHADWGQHR